MTVKIHYFISFLIIAFLIMNPAHAQTEITSFSSVIKYTCPMHPHYIAEGEGTCPICGMDLVPLESGGGSSSMEEEGAVRSISISPETIQNMGVRIKPAETVRFGRKFRAYGLVDVDTRLQTVVTGRVEGWLEDVKIRAVGDPVRQGMLLFRLYSPELISAQRDFISALNGKSRQRLQSAETRLRSLGVGSKVVKQLRKNKSVIEKVPFYAISNGLVSELPVRQGAYVRPGSMITRIQSYDRVWLNASVPEKDLSSLQVRDAAAVSFPNLPGKTINTTIDYIYPEVDSNSRTGTVRLVLDNTEHNLRPGTYADVVFQVDQSNRLAVADESILMDARGAYLVVAMGEGRFESRAIKTGLSSDGYTEITQGVEEGEAVVVSGQFLIDSESSLRESFTKLKRLQTPYKLLSLNKTDMAMVDHLVDAALYVHESIVDGFDMQVNFLQAARDIKQPLLAKFSGTQLEFLLDDADKSLVAVMQARSESEIYSALHQLVTVLKPWMINGKPEYYLGKDVYLFRDIKSQRLWVQQEQEAYNPYQEDGNAEMISYPDRLMTANEG